MNQFVVDFESYYGPELNVSDIGVRNYCDQSYAYMVSIVGDGVEFVGTPEEAAKKFNRYFFEESQFWAANAVFDETWAKRYWGDRMLPWKCIFDKGAPNQYAHSMDKLMAGLYKTGMDKTTRDAMKGVHYRELPPEKQQIVLDYCLNDAREEWKCLHDLPEVSAIEDKLSAWTRMTNKRGVRIDRERVERDKQVLLEGQHKAKWSLPWVDEREVPLSPQELKKWCQYKGYPCPPSRDKRDPVCEQLMIQYPELGEVINNMRNYQSYNALIKKINSLLGRLNDEDELPLELIYCGARHTRRWSSRGVNVQNLAAKPIYVGDHEVSPRKWFVARPGKTYYIPDFSQIEPRCLNWMVGNFDLINMIKQGYGLYEAYARANNLWTDARDMKEVDPVFYKTIKAQVLGLGYGMGAGRFAEVLGTGEEESRAMVKDWRNLNPRIVNKWSEMDATIRDSLRSADRTIELVMPTGDVLRHFMVKAEKGRFVSYTTRGDISPTSKQENLWGGVLVENITQRMARDVLAEAVIKIEEAGIPCLWSSHDEIIMEIDDTPEAMVEAKAVADRIMTTPPEWAPGLPLAVEGDFHKTYTK